MNPVLISLNNEKIELKFSFDALNRITQSNVKIQIFNTHQYTVESKVCRQIFEQFWTYLETGKYPKICSDSYLEFQELSDEFGTMGDYLSSDEIKQSINFENILNKIQITKQNNETAERLISQNLDNCITNYPKMLQTLRITTLYNIFSHPQRILDDQDKAYHYIIEVGFNQDPNFFILLNTLDAIQFNNYENLRDAAVNREKHLDFCPKNISYFTFFLEQKINKLEKQPNIGKDVFNIDSNFAAKRLLLKMFKNYQDYPSSYFNCGLSDNNPFKWRLIINGVANTILAGALFPAELIFPDNYPLLHPIFKFKCPIWHPNIDEKTGEICPFTEKNYSKEQWWNPTITVEVIILDIILLLQKPNQESILNIQAYNEFINDKEKYNTTLKRCVRRSIEYL